FLYSGTLNAELETLAEVAIIADKYQVLDLAMHCLDLLKKELNAETAWEILKAAEQFELGDLREAAMHTILISPKVALWKRPFVSEDLLDQVLSSDLMCIPDEVLFDLFLGWEEGEGCLSRRELIEKYVCLQSVPSEKIKAFVLNPKFNILKARKPRKIPVTEHTVDLEGRLALQPYCSSSTGTGEWMEWKLPSHFALKLLGFRVTDQLENLDFCLWCGNHNQGIKHGKHQQVFSSQAFGSIQAGQLIQCRCDFLVRCIRGEVNSPSAGLLASEIRFEGLLQDFTAEAQREAIPSSSWWHGEGPQGSVLDPWHDTWVDYHDAWHTRDPWK
ncbi:BTB/POZ domain-containing protein 2, partial [Durusdinium trenchii]